MPDVLSVSSTSLEQLRQELERLHLLHATGMELGASLELAELLPLALERMRSPVGAGAGTLWMVDGEGMVRCRVGAGEIGTRLLGAQRPWSEVAEPSGSVVGATLVAPLIVGQERVGIVQLSEKAGAGLFQRDD